MDVITVIVVVWLGGYAIACVTWPFTACGKCEGAGRFRSPSRKNWRPCPRCEGSGKRIRTGRQMVEMFRFGPRRGR